MFGLVVGDNANEGCDQQDMHPMQNRIIIHDGEHTWNDKRADHKEKKPDQEIYMGDFTTVGCIQAVDNNNNVQHQERYCCWQVNPLGI